MATMREPHLGSSVEVPDAVTIPLEAVLDAAAHLRAVNFMALDVLGDFAEQAIGGSRLYESADRLLEVALGVDVAESDALGSELCKRAEKIADEWRLDLAETAIPLGKVLLVLAAAGGWQEIAH
jgi:hypothetical protein